MFNLNQELDDLEKLNNEFSALLNPFAKPLKNITSSTELNGNSDIKSLTSKALLKIETFLSQAIRLEFATIPLYLSALWTINFPDFVEPVEPAEPVELGHPSYQKYFEYLEYLEYLEHYDLAEKVRQIILEILHEEMLHMVLVGNISSAFQINPELAGLVDFPIGDLPILKKHKTIPLMWFSEEALETFLFIESPSKPFEIRKDGKIYEIPKNALNKDKTIGKYYAEIKVLLTNYVRAQERVGKKIIFDTSKQISGPLAPMIIGSLEDCLKAIDIISVQGEGTCKHPFEDENRDKLCHFYRFLEILNNQKLVWNDSKQQLIFSDEALTSPKVDLKKLFIDREKFSEKSIEELVPLHKDFNNLYSRLINNLEKSWTDVGNGNFLKSMELMFILKGSAKKIVESNNLPQFKYNIAFNEKKDTQNG